MELRSSCALCMCRCRVVCLKACSFTEVGSLYPPLFSSLVDRHRVPLAGLTQEMILRPHLLLLGWAARCAGEHCAVSTVVVHCESNCAGVNATSWASTNPPAMLLLSPKAAANERSAVLAELEAASSPPNEMTPPGPMYLQIEEQQVEPTVELTHGTPAFAGAVTAEQFTEAAVYALAYEAISPDDLIGHIGHARQTGFVIPTRHRGEEQKALPTPDDKEQRLWTGDR